MHTHITYPFVRVSLDDTGTVTSSTDTGFVRVLEIRVVTVISVVHPQMARDYCDLLSPYTHYLAFC